MGWRAFPRRDSILGFSGPKGLGSVWLRWPGSLLILWHVFVEYLQVRCWKAAGKELHMSQFPGGFCAYNTPRHAAAIHRESPAVSGKAKK